MKQSIANRRPWLMLVGVLLLFIVVSYSVTSPKPEDYPDYVSESPSPTGTKGLYTYLDDVSKWSHTPELLPKQDENQLLVMVQPFFISETDQMKAYQTFIEAGNTILLLQTNPDGMFDLKTSYIEEQPKESAGNVYNQTAEKYRAKVSTSVRLQTNEQDEVLLYDDMGTIAFKRDYGKGELIVSTTPTWMTNQALLEEDHLPLVLSLIQAGSQMGTTILFDEYSHGTENASTLQAVYPKWMLVLAVQVILITIIWLWYQGKRFGPLVIARQETVRFSDERIKALAAWYLRSKNYHASIVIQANYLKLLLQERLGIPYHKGWSDLINQLKRKLPDLPEEDIQFFLTELPDVLTKEKLTKQEYLLWSKKIDRIRKEVDGDEERANILT